MLQLRILQQRLEAIYEVHAGHCVSDFVVTDRELAERLGGELREVAETLLVRQRGEDLDLSLYLDSALLDRLQAGEPADLCSALEGISHFLCLVWKASNGRNVSCLELEMQAEVDKYIVLALSGYHGKGLHGWLFADPIFDAALSAAERVRYRDANRYAAKYCRHLENSYLNERRGELLNELRRFYRLSLRGKIQRIQGIQGIT